MLLVTISKWVARTKVVNILFQVNVPVTCLYEQLMFGLIYDKYVNYFVHVLQCNGFFLKTVQCLYFNLLGKFQYKISLFKCCKIVQSILSCLLQASSLVKIEQTVQCPEDLFLAEFLFHCSIKTYLIALPCWFKSVFVLNLFFFSLLCLLSFLPFCQDLCC
jgi:hypothetical protein